MSIISSSFAGVPGTLGLWVQGMALCFWDSWDLGWKAQHLFSESLVAGRGAAE